MTELATITLENEMDLTLAYKRSIITAAMLGLTIATQTAFATAVSEVCREIIDKATNGILALGAEADQERFFIVASINCNADESLDKNNEGFDYARKLVPVLDIEKTEGILKLLLKLGIPRSTRINQLKVIAVKNQIEADGPVSPYEEVKKRNAVLADLTQQQEMALDLANKLDQQKTEFLSTASHELNSPLTVLRSYSQMALRLEAGADTAVRKYLQKIDTQTGKLVNLVRQLMDISKFQKGNIDYNIETISLHNFIQNITEPIRLLVSTHIVTVTQGADCDLQIDQLRIEQVLNNLAVNAAKYSEPGSEITITTAIEGDNAVIAVEDNGIGMSTETQQKVFEKFYRDKGVEKRYHGLGMGLYIASRIVNDHKGSMDVSSQEGKGSTFTFTLPTAN